MSTLAIIILTYNEERHLPRALDHIAGLASEVFVIDSGSTDRTTEIALARGLVVIKHPFVNHAMQFQWALDNAPITADWVMRLDADEVVEPDLATEIKERLPSLPLAITGVNLKRKHIFLGRWVRHGGRYPLILLRIWRRGMARIENRWMDEHMILLHGSPITFKGGFADHNLNDLTFFIDKHNKYATREAIDVLNERYRFFPRDLTPENRHSSIQAATKRFAKEKIYNSLPFWLSSTGYFLFRYFIQLGILDGTEGLAYHFLQGYWYRFLVGVKVIELDRAIHNLPDRDAKLQELSRRTGHRLV